MKIIVDENITQGKEAFSKFGEVNLLNGRDITNEKLEDVDVLITRSITKVNEELLSGTSVKFVGTATIGTDHIDIDYLKQKEIYFSNAAGCNSFAVAEYVFNAITKFAVKYNFPLKEKTIGVIGVGNIGSKIVNFAKALGMNVLQNDPPLQRTSGSKDFVSLDTALSADIITFHVPLNKEGIDKTFHLLDREKILNLKDNTILINASRGEVVDNNALSDLIEEKNLIVNLDVWENEPNPNPELLNKLKIGTPHIAGYSYEGKINGTIMIYEQLCNFLNTDPGWKPFYPDIQNSIMTIDNNLSIEKNLHNIFNKIYKIEDDDNKMRKILKLAQGERGKYFDKMRKEYPYRREFNNYRISNAESVLALLDILNVFRFQVG